MTYLVFYLYSIYMSFTKNKKVYYVVNIFVFTMIFGFRYRVGADWGAYEDYFYGRLSSKFELGYDTLNKIIYNLFGNFNVLILIIFVFICIVQLKAIEYFSDNYSLGIVMWLGIGFLSFGILRQSIAIAISLIALIYLSRERYIQFIVFVITAALFHNSAIILLILLALKNNMSRKKAITIVFISIVIYLIKLDLIVFNILSYMPLIGEKISFYMKVEEFNMPLGIGVRFIEALILFMISSIYKDRLEVKCKYFNLLYKILVLYILLYMGLNGVATIASRTIKYFEIGHIILFTYLVSIPKNKNLRILVLIGLYIYVGLRYLMTITGGLSLQSNINTFLPYKNYLVQMFL